MCCRRTQSVLDLDRSIATNHYTALAHAARAGRAELPADHLLPGDAIELDGCVLTVELVTVTDHMVILAVAGFDWSRSLNRDRLVRLA